MRWVLPAPFISASAFNSCRQPCAEKRKSLRGHAAEPGPHPSKPDGRHLPFPFTCAAVPSQKRGNLLPYPLPLTPPGAEQRRQEINLVPPYLTASLYQVKDFHVYSKQHRQDALPSLPPPPPSPPPPPPSGGLITVGSHPPSNRGRDKSYSLAQVTLALITAPQGSFEYQFGANELELTNTGGGTCGCPCWLQGAGVGALDEADL